MYQHTTRTCIGAQERSLGYDTRSYDWDTGEHQMKVHPVRSELALQESNYVQLFFSSVQAYHEMLNEKTKLVSMVYISNVLGCILPAEQVTEAAHKV